MREGCTQCVELYARRTFHLFHHMLDRRAAAVGRWHAADQAWRQHLGTHETESTACQP